MYSCPSWASRTLLRPQKGPAPNIISINTVDSAALRALALQHLRNESGAPSGSDSPAGYGGTREGLLIGSEETMANKPKCSYHEEDLKASE